MTQVAFYVDSHGFGHSTRSIALSETFPPDWEVVFRTNAPSWLFEENGVPAHKVLPSPFDIHPVHSRGYRIDVEATLETASRKLDEAEALVEGEKDWLQKEEIDFVLSDVSPLAVRAGARAGLPTYGIGNFTWDWIFEPLFKGFGGEAVITVLREMMAEATINFRPPFSEESTFPKGSLPTPLVVRDCHRSRTEARDYFGFDPDHHYILLTFGGFEAPQRSLSRIEEFQPLQFVRLAPREERLGATSQSPLVRDSAANNLWNVMVSDLHHPDLVLAADAAITKPGYGTLSEVMSTNTPMVMDSRHDFREFEAMRKDLEIYPQVAFVEHEAIVSLEIKTELEGVLRAKPLPWQQGLDGAQVIVKRILEDYA